MAQVPKPRFDRSVQGLIRGNRDAIGQIQRSLVQSEWVPLALVNGYVAYGSTFSGGEYMLDSMGFVHIRGLIKNAAGFVYNTVITHLPVGFRPEYSTHHHTACYKVTGNIQVPTYVVVDPDGQMRQGVIGSSLTPDGSWLSIDGFSYKAFS